MRKKERYEKVIAWFQANVPVAETELHYNNPYELLIAVILSAQCTDKRVNMITPPLYKDFPTPEALAASTPEVIFEYIRSVSYPNNKAKHLVGMAKMLVNDFNSKVPDNMDDLIKLPGVGRKTANVIQSVVFNKAAMAVDTHVFRVSHRIAPTSVFPKISVFCGTGSSLYKATRSAGKVAISITAWGWNCIPGCKRRAFILIVPAFVVVRISAGAVPQRLTRGLASTSLPPTNSPSPSTSKITVS